MTTEKCCPECGSDGLDHAELTKDVVIDRAVVTRTVETDGGEQAKLEDELVTHETVVYADEYVCEDCGYWDKQQRE